MNYGALPEDLGLIDLSPTEMMFWMYCPVRVPGGLFVLPPSLRQFEPILKAAWIEDAELIDSSYVYLTAKTLWVSGEYIGNRPGWHSDGFGTDDVNYIWSDRAPTEFLSASFDLSPDCQDAMAEMERQAADPENEIVTYSDKHLLRLTPEVIHRSPVGFTSGMRSFVKVSISQDRYNLAGNSINHDLPESWWPLVQRQTERNHPARLA